MNTKERIMVVFVNQCSPYQAGERAAFFPKAAKKLVADGLARYEKFDDEEIDVTAEEAEDVDEQTNDGGGSAKKRSGKGTGKSKKSKGSDKPGGKRKRVKAG